MMTPENLQKLKSEVLRQLDFAADALGRQQDFMVGTMSQENVPLAVIIIAAPTAHELTHFLRGKVDEFFGEKPFRVDINR